MELPKRKQMRLQAYDYSENGAYFVTICTQNRRCILGDVGADSISARMIDEMFRKTMEEYQNVSCSKYVIMPNHFHAIIVISRADMESAPTISQIIQSFKRRSTIEYIKMVKAGMLPPFEQRIWQRSFHEHIIRNQKAYDEIWQYIDTNPLKWELDCYFME